MPRLNEPDVVLITINNLYKFAVFLYLLKNRINAVGCLVNVIHT